MLPFYTFIIIVQFYVIFQLKIATEPSKEFAVFLHILRYNKLGFYYRIINLIHLSIIYNTDIQNIKVKMVSEIKLIKFVTFSKQQTKINLTH